MVDAVKFFQRSTFKVLLVFAFFNFSVEFTPLSPKAQAADTWSDAIIWPANFYSLLLAIYHLGDPEGSDSEDSQFKSWEDRRAKKKWTEGGKDDVAKLRKGLKKDEVWTFKTYQNLWYAGMRYHNQPKYEKDYIKIFPSSSLLFLQGEEGEEARKLLYERFEEGYFSHIDPKNTATLINNFILPQIFLALDQLGDLGSEDDSNQFSFKNLEKIGFTPSDSEFKVDVSNGLLKGVLNPIFKSVTSSELGQEVKERAASDIWELYKQSTDPAATDRLRAAKFANFYYKLDVESARILTEIEKLSGDDIKRLQGSMQNIINQILDVFQKTFLDKTKELFDFIGDEEDAADITAAIIQDIFGVYTTKLSYHEKIKLIFDFINHPKYLFNLEEAFYPLLNALDPAMQKIFQRFASEIFNAKNTITQEGVIIGLMKALDDLEGVPRWRIYELLIESEWEEHGSLSEEVFGDISQFKGKEGGKLKALKKVKEHIKILKVFKVGSINLLVQAEITDLNGNTRIEALSIEKPEAARKFEYMSEPIMSMAPEVDRAIKRQNFVSPPAKFVLMEQLNNVMIELIRKRTDQMQRIGYKLYAKESHLVKTVELEGVKYHLNFGIGVPEPYGYGKRYLRMEWLDGAFGLNTVRPEFADPLMKDFLDGWVRTALRETNTLKELGLEDEGFAHADAHGGNIVLYNVRYHKNADGSISVSGMIGPVDYGMVATLKKEQQAAIWDIVLSLFLIGQVSTNVPDIQDKLTKVPDRIFESLLLLAKEGDEKPNPEGLKEDLRNFARTTEAYKDELPVNKVLALATDNGFEIDPALFGIERVASEVRTGFFEDADRDPLAIVCDESFVTDVLAFLKGDPGTSKAAFKEISEVLNRNKDSFREVGEMSAPQLPKTILANGVKSVGRFISQLKSKFDLLREKEAANNIVLFNEAELGEIGKPEFFERPSMMVPK